MKSSQRAKVIVIPCSGIGKPLGSVSREAVYELIENARRQVTDTICLALLIRGDKEALQVVQNNKCITIDGCPMQCAKKNLEHASGNLVASYRAVDVLKKHRNLKPKSVTFLDQDGKKLAVALAAEVATKVDEILGR